jgi:hypothetical protein
MPNVPRKVGRVVIVIRGSFGTYYRRLRCTSTVGAAYVRTGAVLAYEMTGDE